MLMYVSILQILAYLLNNLYVKTEIVVKMNISIFTVYKYLFIVLLAILLPTHIHAYLLNYSRVHEYHTIMNIAIYKIPIFNIFCMPFHSIITLFNSN